jgi:hypothetical protein
LSILGTRSRKLAALACVMAAVVAGAGCRKKAASLFPASNIVAGWEKTGDTRSFAAKDLWQYIDGEAEQYIKAGVVTASTADYKFQGKIEATVDVYTMGGAAGARQILEAGQSGDAKSVPLGDAGIAYAQSVSFRKGSHLVRVVAYDAAPGTQEALIALARGVEKAL